VDIVGRTEAVLAVLQNKKAMGTDGVPTAVSSWLPFINSYRTKLYEESADMVAVFSAIPHILYEDNADQVGTNLPQ